jgi:hypothetical protein
LDAVLEKQSAHKRYLQMQNFEVSFVLAIGNRQFQSQHSYRMI